MEELHRPPSGGREEEGPPIPEPSSPLFQRPHPQPAPRQVEEDPFLRRRPARQDSQPGPSHLKSGPAMPDNGQDEDSVSITIATPYNEVDSKKRDAQRTPRNRTVGQIKDEVAVGQWDGDEWERDRMRLVWQGRIVRDDELVGDVLGSSRDVDQTHTFHLVARRKASSHRPIPLPLPQPAPIDVPAPPPSQPNIKPQDRTSRALEDTVHFILFLARRHLFLFMGYSPLRWEDVTPPPAIEEAMARTAVMSVVRALASEQGEGVWRECEKAFEEDVEVVWDVLGREGLEDELRLVWKTILGRGFTEGTKGEIVTVEFDGVAQELNIPPIETMSPKQLCHLLQYLRTVALLPCLNHLLELSATPPPVPTPTTVQIQVPAPGPGVREIYRLQLHFQLPTISVALLSHAFFSAVKICAMLWMLSQGMKRTDVRLWIIVGGAVGWWIGDVMYEARQERARRRPPVPPAQAGAPPAAGAGAGANANQRGRPDAPGDLRMPGRVRPANQGAMQVLTESLPLLHIDTDAQQLHLNGQPARTPLRRPPRLLTQFLLPAALWFITLIPEWESLRARAIRRRERSMRVLVGEMSAAPSPVTETAPLPHINGALDDQDTEHQEDEPAPNGHGSPEDERQSFANGLGADLQRNVIRVYPLGLNAVAKRYYERVMDRGEGIDWEEEREAQRAMGIGEEEERDQGGMRMGVL